MNTPKVVCEKCRQEFEVDLDFDWKLFCKMYRGLANTITQEQAQSGAGGTIRVCYPCVGGIVLSGWQQYLRSKENVNAH